MLRVVRVLLVILVILSLGLLVVLGAEFLPKDGLLGNVRIACEAICRFFAGVFEAINSGFNKLIGFTPRS